MTQKKLLYGTAYYDEYMPQSRVEEDMLLMKRAGINLIRIAESTWSTWEPEEGVFDFRSLHRVLSAAQRHDISVIVGTPTYAIPPWMAKKHPDILVETHTGASTYGPRQNMDITHPQYRFYCERIIRKMLEQCLVYDNVIGYQLDNETKHYDNCGHRVQEQFRAYLQEKYETVDALNRAFGLAYWSNAVSSWEDLPDVRGTINASYGAAFQEFQRSLVTEFLSWQTKIVSEYLHDDQFITHNFDLSWKGYSYGIQPAADHFQVAGALHIAGIDIYHPAGLHNTGAEIAFGGDLARSLKNNNYLVLETQCQGTMGSLPYPGQLRLNAFHHLACGANCVEYWHWHSIHNACESYWKGILSHDLIPGRAYKECCSIGSDLSRIGHKLIGLTKRNKVAILVSQKSLDGFSWFPTSGWRNVPSRDYNDYLRWIYDAFYRMNLEVDILSDTCRDFSGYDVLVTPGLYSVDESLITAIRHYVAAGGRLIATFRSFFADEALKIRAAAQPYGMTDVFGMTYDEFTIPEQTRLKVISGTVKDWMELLRPDPDTEVLAGYDSPGWPAEPAVTRHAFGKGSAVYIGCYTPDGIDGLLARILDDWKIERPELRWPAIVKRGTNAFGEKLIYVMNYSNETHHIPAPATGSELLTGNPVREGEPMDMNPWDVRILEVET